MSKHLTNEQIDNRLGAVMNAFKEENATSVFNMNSVARLLESGHYSISVSEKLKSASDRDINNDVAMSIKRLTTFVNRISDIVYKGAEECDLDSQIDDNRKFWEELKSILNP
jgi:phage gp37-like protein